MNARDEANAALAEAREWLAAHPHFHSARKSDVKRLCAALVALLEEAGPIEYRVVNAGARYISEETNDLAEARDWAETSGDVIEARRSSGAWIPLVDES